MIESVNNPKIQQYAKLMQKKYRDATNLFIAEGEHLVEEAKKQGLVEEIFALENRDGATVVSPQVMRKLSSLDTINNVVAICHKRKPEPIKGNVLILDNIQDPGNLGTIIRSANAFNIATIILSSDTVDEYNAKVLRATEGLLFNMNIIRGPLVTILPKLNNYAIYTTNVKGGIPIRELELSKPYALIMGNEGQGVKDAIAAYANKTIYIPMQKDCESLNVAIATSIILYEFSLK